MSLRAKLSGFKWGWWGLRLWLHLPGSWKMWIFLCGSFKSSIMSLFTLARQCCLKDMRPDVFWTRNMGYVIVFTRRPLMSEFCLVTAVLNTVGVNNRTPSLCLPPSVSLPEFPLTQTHSRVWPHTASHPPYTHTHNHPQRDEKRKQTKSSLMAACSEKTESTWKADPFKVEPGAWSWTTRGMAFSLCLQREWYTTEM